MPLPRVGLILHPRITPFHFSVPYTVFGMELPDQPLFDLSIVAPEGTSLESEGVMTLRTDGGLALLDNVDIAVVPGWHDLDESPAPELAEALVRCHERGAYVVGLCFGTYALAYAGLLDGRRASTHWVAEQDFSERFPSVKLDTNALYVEEDRLVTSAGTAAGLDCCLFLVRKYYGAQIANKIARIMVVPPHREGGQAQFIEQPVAVSTQDAHINRLLDYLRENLVASHSIDDLAARTAMSRRTFTRHFQKATGMTVVEWLVNERLRHGRELLETTSLSVEAIAERVGFHTATSFRQHFRHRHQVSPRDWRKTFGDNA
ncbi:MULTISPECIES: helix-turn-helix domain-containing protein [unclassified Halomonas]|uniref:GlxA family transcriptional regulator n=1 Tax=unclassified Halomonas TaxID=2609666 RepID=UPI0007D93FD1|nr:MULTISPECIES: helix-turn-helix domain-containing protein [unclassified Halomonas]MBT2788252.1 helix-turn-helix domain-containing protein [Halomonas sp. ISL-106]MBT2796001.1 helix-turn-helix domain-containing protein [Halomonas sp. ISL-104]OAL61271.1 AraC family transcriptional regulator [Halomonas sp. ALS9]